MNNKRRTLQPKQEVIILYDVELGFIQQSAKFISYREIDFNGIKHQIPVFNRNNSEITGLSCFWVTTDDIIDDLDIEKIQRELLDLQLKVTELKMLRGFKMPEKIVNKELNSMAKNNVDYRNQLVKQLGYDPLDYSWVENELSENDLERNWFEFIRKKHGSIDDNWDKNIGEFKKDYQNDITIAQAFSLTRKWKRFIIGAWHTIASKNSNMDNWKTAARKFEIHHREVEERMKEWSIANQNNYPRVKVKQPIQFRHGPYFNECIERVPHLFTNIRCYFIRPEIILRVVSYDPKFKYIRLDFEQDICDIIKPGISPNDPWAPLKADYIIYVPPDQVETHLEFLEEKQIQS